MASLSYKPKQVTKRILSGLHDRAYEVLVNRFGLNDAAVPMTLEAIGNQYGVTRERVRQIEHAALQAVRKSDNYQNEQAAFKELHSLIESLGGIVHEEELLSHISDDPSVKNHVHLHLVIGEQFHKHKEDDHFHPRWAVNHEVAQAVHDSLHALYSSLSDQELISEAELVNRFITSFKTLHESYLKEEIARRWITLSKRIGKNPLGEWGLTDSANIKTRGVKDYAYLVMRKHGSPMHFREVAKAIEKTFGKKTHVATCHNELIKDTRFVLVGRGIYALRDWGYKAGVVRDVIRDLLKETGPMAKEDIIDRMMKERYLKKNTIVVNLQNAKYFKKTKDGLYTLA